MNSLRWAAFGRGLFWVVLALAGTMSLNDIEALPLLLIFALLAAPLLFPRLRRHIKMRRVAILSLGAMAVFLGTFYWIICFYHPDDSGALAADCLWAIWPLGDLLNGGVPQIDWVPLWILKGLLFGFLMESLLALTKLAQRDIAVPAISHDEPLEAHQPPQPPFGAAGTVCLVYMAIIYLASIPLVTLYPSRLTGWLLFIVYMIGPLSGVFMVLYFSGWYRQRTTASRLFSVMWRACAVFGVTSLFVALIILGVLTFLLFGFYGYGSGRGQYEVVWG
jgi:hypothetical protein